MAIPSNHRLGELLATLGSANEIASPIQASTRPCLKLIYDGIPQPSRIALPMLGKLDNALGDHEHGWVIAIHQAQGAHGILERGREHGYILRRE
jgi:hypothetical protein